MWWADLHGQHAVDIACGQNFASDISFDSRWTVNVTITTDPSHAPRPLINSTLFTVALQQTQSICYCALSFVQYSKSQLVEEKLLNTGVLFALRLFSQVFSTPGYNWKRCFPHIQSVLYVLEFCFLLFVYFCAQMCNNFTYLFYKLIM